MAEQKTRSVEFLDLVKAQAKFMLNNPMLIIVVLALAGVSAFFSYQQVLGEPETAAVAAGMFTALWGVVYIALPFILMWLFYLAIIGVVSAVAIMAFKTGDLAGIGVVGGGMLLSVLAMGIVGIIITAVFMFGPGYLAYEAAKIGFESQGAGIAAAIGVSVSWFALCAFLYRFVIPFILTWFWVVGSANLCLKAVSTIMGVSETFSYVGRMPKVRMTTDSNVWITYIVDYWEVIKAYIIPGPFIWCVMAFATVVACVVTVKASHLAGWKIGAFQLPFGRKGEPEPRLS